MNKVISKMRQKSEHVEDINQKYQTILEELDQKNINQKGNLLKKIDKT